MTLYHMSQTEKVSSNVCPQAKETEEKNKKQQHPRVEFANMWRTYRVSQVSYFTLGSQSSRQQSSVIFVKHFYTYIYFNTLLEMSINEGEGFKENTTAGHCESLMKAQELLITSRFSPLLFRTVRASHKSRTLKLKHSPNNNLIIHTCAFLTVTSQNVHMGVIH